VACRPQILSLDRHFVGLWKAGPSLRPILIRTYDKPSERCKAIVSVSGYLISSPAGNQTPWPPQAAFAFWYQYYFATEVGKAGYGKYLDEFNKFILHQASPKWNFDDATYNRTAASFNTRTTLTS
jgi:hypothetical protein